MSRNRSKKIQGKFIAVEHSMFFSAAWQELNSSDIHAYMLIKSQMKHSDDKEIVCPYSFVAKRMQRRTFARSIRKLESLGFIKRWQRGGLYRRTNIFFLSNDWRSFQKNHSLVDTKWGVQKQTVKNDSDGLQKQTPRGEKGKILSISGVQKQTTHSLQKQT